MPSGDLMTKNIIIIIIIVSIIIIVLEGAIYCIAGYSVVQ